MSLTHCKSIRRQQGPIREMSYSCSIYCLISHKHAETINWDQPSQGQEAPRAAESPQLLNRGMGHGEEMHTKVSPTDRRTWVLLSTRHFRSHWISDKALIALSRLWTGLSGQRAGPSLELTPRSRHLRGVHSTGSTFLLLGRSISNPPAFPMPSTYLPMCAGMKTSRTGLFIVKEFCKCTCLCHSYRRVITGKQTAWICLSERRFSV